MEQLTALDKREIYRYLGYHGGSEPPVASLDALVEDCIRQVLAAAQPRVVFGGPYPLSREPQLQAASLPLEGSDMALHLAGCTQVMLQAVTLGVPLDALIRRTEAVDMARAVVLDAAANAAVEQAAQQAEDALRQRLAPGGQYLTGRYSPGYGDFPLSVQREVLRLTDAARRIGLTVTASHILTPRKSITAVLGIAPIPVRGHLAGCAHCVLRKTCIFRKRGQTCAVSDP